MPLLKLKQALAQQIASHLNHPDLGAESFFGELSAPPNIALGQLALPCFRMGKALKKSPVEIAKELATGLTSGNLSAKATGPYVNFRWEPSFLYSEVLKKIGQEKSGYGKDDSGKKERIAIEYCSPNIAKRLGFQHIRSTLIGNTLANIYDALGHQTERINFVGDWGAQFARLLAAVELWGKPEDFAEGGKFTMDELLALYVRFHKEVENSPELLEKASQCLQRLEKQEPTTTALWQRIKSVSIQAMNTTLSRMNIRFHHVEGESTYIPAMDSTLQTVKKKSGAVQSEGAWIIELEGISTPALIQKRDGTTLYLTRDIAAAQDRWNRFHFSRNYYVVSEQQKLHFQQLFGTIKKMGYDWADKCGHISFGTVLFGSEKMSTREGRVIFLDELLDEAQKLALEECTKKNPALKNKEEVAEQVGIGAIIFGNLSSHRLRDIEFSWENVLALDGETGPYVQYSFVRCQSLIEKSGESSDISDLTLPEGYVFSPEEESLVLCLGQFRSVLHDCLRENEPYLLTHYLIDVAKAFNRFYYRFPVLQASDPLQKQLRLNLVRGSRQVIENGLELLGIRCPKEM